MTKNLKVVERQGGLLVMKDLRKIEKERETDRERERWGEKERETHTHIHFWHSMPLKVHN